MKLTPLSDRVIVKMVEAEETTKSGIILAGCCEGKAADRRGNRSRPRRQRSTARNGSDG